MRHTLRKSGLYNVGGLPEAMTRLTLLMKLVNNFVRPSTRPT
jgi:hypothetical protein